MAERVRFGGYDRGDGYVFELSGGNPVLDFVNTLDERGGKPKELLTEYGRLLDWSRQARLVSEPAWMALRRAAERDPEASRRVLAAGRDLREALFSVVRCMSEKTSPPGAAVKTLAEWKRRADARKVLEFESGRLVVGYDDEEDLSAMLWRVVDASVRLFGAADSCRRIKLCHGKA